MIKIFQMSEHDWFAAETLDEAKQAVMKTFGPPAEGQTVEEFFDEMLEGYEPHELTDEELSHTQFTEVDDYEESIASKSFRQKLAEMVAAGEKFPCIFASSEF
jgi:hypothetical protein